jgi:hypothetical protein
LSKVLEKVDTFEMYQISFLKNLQKTIPGVSCTH